MDNAYEPLKFAAGIVMTLVLVAIGFRMFQDGTRAGYGILDELSPAMEGMEKLSIYDGNVSGSEVINAIKRYQKEYPVKVITGSNAATYTGQFEPGQNKPGKAEYVNPAKTYVGTVKKDENEFVTGLEFREE